MKWTEKQIEEWLILETREIQFRDRSRHVEMNRLAWSDFDFAISHKVTSFEDIIRYSHEEHELQGWTLEEAFKNVVEYIGNSTRAS